MENKISNSPRLASAQTAHTQTIKKGSFSRKKKLWKNWKILNDFNAIFSCFFKYDKIDFFF